MHDITRRDWLVATACWAEVLRAQQKSYAYLDAHTAAEIDALADTIIPAGSISGARQAGVIWFIDRTLAVFEPDKRALYRTGLSDVETKRANMFPESLTIAELTPDQRNVLLQSIEQTDFFRVLRLHTILGFFGHPGHGGNRDLAGFKLLGREDVMHFQPPFGYYDQEAKER
jgi:gluconate 2-dehydrogenase gamma chain